jgi:hypothetical protein
MDYKSLCFLTSALPNIKVYNRSMTQCHLCGEINYSGEQIKDLARALIRLQRQIQPVIESYEKGRKAHPRCASCGILAGPEHLVTELMPEPMIPRARGQKRYNVCQWCYTDLHKSRQSVPQRRKIQQRVDEMLKGEDEETADTDIDSIMRAIHNELMSSDIQAEPKTDWESADDDPER